jgi:hypothetical protein
MGNKIKMMIDSKQFILLVQKEFGFLETDFGFSYNMAGIDSREYFCLYRKGELVVKILYSLTNEFIEITIYNFVSKVPMGKYDWKYSVTLAHLMMREIVHFNFDQHYNFCMPKYFSIEISLHKVAELLKNYGRKILEEKEWVSWGEIAGYNQPVPPNLP